MIKGRRWELRSGSSAMSPDSVPHFYHRHVIVSPRRMLSETMMEAAREAAPAHPTTYFPGNWRRAEPGRLGEAKQDRPSGLLDGKLLPESARIPGNIARLPMRAGTQQLSARRTIPAPLLIRYCGAEVSRILPAVDMVLAVFEALHRSVAISAHLFRAALADIGKAPPKSARGRAPRARCQSG